MSYAACFVWLTLQKQKVVQFKKIKQGKEVNPNIWGAIFDC